MAMIKFYNPHNYNQANTRSNKKKRNSFWFNKSNNRKIKFKNTKSNKPVGVEAIVVRVSRLIRVAIHFYKQERNGKNHQINHFI